MSDSSPASETGPHGLGEGIALALKAEDGGDWKPVVEWLARNPIHARGVAEFLAGQRGLASAIAGPRPVLPEPQRAVGGYELREEIGRGGMGVVCKAFDPTLKREVAVKFVRTGCELSDAELARFRYEAEIAAALDHTNVVPVYASGEADGVPYLVMRLMTGGSLAEWLKKHGPNCLPSAEEAARIVRAIALGIHHAHQRGLIHRDLKPANILLDSDGAPHVADFGLARPVDASVTGVAGTPAYMAPEQVRGDKYLTTGVDVHALGVILFELLTGRTPFGSDSVMSVLKRVQDDPAPAVRTFRPDVSADLETICFKCLQKVPGDRYGSAHELADDLTKFLNGEPIGDHRGWVWATVRRAIARQHRTTAMTSWGVLFWGAASTFLAMIVMQAAVWLKAPLWVSQLAIAYYLLAWLGIMWGFLVVRRDSLTAVERASTAIHFGAKFGCMAILPVQLWLHGGDPVFALPSFLVLVGLVIYVHGILYWGRFYVAGLVFFLVAALLPLAPTTIWPAIYGLMLGGAQLLIGFHVHSTFRRDEAARQASA